MKSSPASENIVVQKLNIGLCTQITARHYLLSLSSIVTTASDSGGENIVPSVALAMATVKSWVHSSAVSSMRVISAQAVSPNIDDVGNVTINMPGVKSSPRTENL